MISINLVGPLCAVAMLFGAFIGTSLAVLFCEYRGHRARYIGIKALAKKLEDYPWETFESAPKDGNLILAWIPGPKWISIIFWNESEQRWLQAGSHFQINTMTHWRRLPGAPS